MKGLLVVTAVTEAAAGVALLCCPSAAAAVLLGGGLETPVAATVARVAGVALVALGLACGLAHRDVQSRAARGLVVGMTVYDIGVALCLAGAATLSKTEGILLWPAVAFHVFMTGWCFVHLLKRPAG